VAHLYPLGIIRRMVNSSTKDMVLVYDVSRDAQQKEFLSRFPKQWQSIEQGKTRPKISKGRISKLFFVPYEGEHRFELNEGARQSSWVRCGDESLYSVGRRARVEHVVFRSQRFGGISVVTKIWVGNDDA
jgi:hypothetical protein